MNKIINIFIGFFIVFSFSKVHVFAQTPVSGNSAVLKKIEEPKISSIRVQKLKSFLNKYNSDLVSHSQYIIDKADEYQIPWSMVVAISGVESTFCQSIPSHSYNCWGWNNGASKFNDYHHAIDTVSKTIRKSYFDKGLDTPYEMSHVYAPPSPAWGRKVQHFMNLIENFHIPTFQE